jgi:hypothetical protein
VPNFFSGSQTDPGFQNKNSGCRLTGRLCFMHLQFKEKDILIFTKDYYDYLSIKVRKSCRNANA